MKHCSRLALDLGPLYQVSAPRARCQQHDDRRAAAGNGSNLGRFLSKGLPVGRIAVLHPAGHGRFLHHLFGCRRFPPLVLLRPSARPPRRVEMPAQQVALSRTGETRDPPRSLVASHRIHHLWHAVLLHHEWRMDYDLLRLLGIRLHLGRPPVPRHLHLAGIYAHVQANSN